MLSLLVFEGKFHQYLSPFFSLCLALFPVKANMVATSVDEDEGAEALLEAIAVLDAVPASELEGTWTREVTANSSLSHQTEPGSKLDEPSAD